MMSQDFRAYAAEVKQRHHDMYVKLYRRSRGRLSPEDKREYRLAMLREANGEVKPLPAEPVEWQWLIFSIILAAIGTYVVTMTVSGLCAGVLSGALCYWFYYRYLNGQPWHPF